MAGGAARGRARRPGQGPVGVAAGVPAGRAVAGARHTLAVPPHPRWRPDTLRGGCGSYSLGVTAGTGCTAGPGPAEHGSATQVPSSVTIAVIRLAGVTSKAGL